MIWIEICIFIFIIYAFLIFVYYFGWQGMPVFETLIEPLNIFISVIVPFRNEEKNIANILNDINQQTIGKNLFELIAVNDHSDDDSLSICQGFESKMTNLKIIDLPKEVFGKKNAIKTAIDHSVGELIVTIDADCRVDKKWLQTIATYYSLKKPDMIICPLLYHNENGMFQYLQSLELMSLVASGGSAAAIQHPIMCNGANLAFSKKAYTSSCENLKPEIPSGDDIFLLLALKKQGASKIVFLKSLDALANTEAESNISNFFHQRKRWVSKSKNYNDFDIISVAILIFIVNSILLIALLSAFFNHKFYTLFIALFFIKLIADFPLLHSFAKFFNKRYLLKYIVIAQLVYPVYIVFTAIFGMFGKVQWKQRSYN